MENPSPCGPLIKCTVTRRPSLRVLLWRMTACVRDESDVPPTFLVAVTLATFAPPTAENGEGKLGNERRRERLVYEGVNDRLSILADTGSNYAGTWLKQGLHPVAPAVAGVRSPP